LFKLPSGYQLQLGSSKDKALLIKFLSIAYQELFPHQKDFSHLSKTVEQYFSRKTPLWWVESLQNSSEVPSLRLPVACLWMGNAINQITGERYSHIFLVYVSPSHRRQGIAKALIQEAQNWAIARGDKQIGLQVFPQNESALNLYHNLGFYANSFLMLKLIEQ
jgi:ribosomal protein S18 acetylase RimI-like enzyme